MTRHPGGRAEPWPIAALSLLSASVFLSVTTELAPTGLMPGMSRELGVSPARLGLLVSGYAIMVALFAAPLGSATVRLPRKKLLVGSLFAYAASNAIMIVAPNYPVAGIARLLGGITHGMFWAILGGYAARLVSPDRVGRAVTIASGGGAASVLLGVPAGTALGVAFGWRVTFAILTGLSLLIVLLAVRLLPDVPGSTATVRTPLHQVLRLPGFPPVVVTTAVTMLGTFTLTTYVAPLLLNAGLTETQVSPVLLLNGLAGTIMLPVAGWLVDRRLREGIIGGGILLIAALAVLALSGHSALMAIAGVVMTGLAMGVLPIFVQAATLRAAPDHPDQASGINAAAFNIGIAGGALIGGVTLDNFGISGVPVVSATLATVGLLVFLTAGRARLT